jgi:hypothetical protein
MADTTLIQMDDQLKALLDYTQFHIGMYVTLSGGIVGVFANDGLKQRYVRFVPFMVISFFCFFFAGVFGGLIGSSIPNFTNFEVFMSSEIGPWRTAFLSARNCATLEHTAFWLGSTVALLGLCYVLLTDKAAAKRYTKT